MSELFPAGLFVFDREARKRGFASGCACAFEFDEETTTFTKIGKRDEQHNRLRMALMLEDSRIHQEAKSSAEGIVSVTISHRSEAHNFLSGLAD